MTRDEKIEMLRKAIVAQTDAMGEAGWMTIKVPTTVAAEGILRVPRAPFELWAVALSGGSHLVSPWKTISPIGVKQGADDPNHTDWMLGAGLGPLDMKIGGPNPWAKALSAAAYAARSEIERRLLSFECSVLLQGHSVTGRVHIPATRDDFPVFSDDGYPPITIVKNAGPDWLEMAMRTFNLGGAVVVERGGEMAHLVTELRQTGGGAIIRKEKARSLYPAGSLLKVDPAHGKLSLEEDDALFSERAALAFNATPLEDDLVAVAVETAAPYKAGFGLVPRDPKKQHPAYHTSEWQPCYRLETDNWKYYAAFHYDKSGHYDLHYGYEMYLMVWAYPVPDPHDRTPRPTFYSDKRIWKDGEVAKAVADVRYMIDADARNEESRFRADLERRKQDERRPIIELSDARLMEEMRRLGQEEDGLWEEKESGDIDQTDYTVMIAEYRRILGIYHDVARERGLEYDSDEVRPYFASHNARIDEQRRAIDAQQQDFDEFMRSTPPERTPPPRRI
jgi:hypothetical protein